MRIQDLLRDQDGVVSREQAMGCGLSPYTVRRRVARGEWEDVHPGVLRDATYGITGDARVRAASLWAGEDGVVSGAAAAFWLGILAPVPDRVGVTVAPPIRRAAPAGIRLRRRTIPVEDRMRHRGVVVTAGALTVLETCASTPEARPSSIGPCNAGGRPRGSCRTPTAATRARTGWPPHAGCWSPRWTGPTRRWNGR